MFVDAFQVTQEKVTGHDSLIRVDPGVLKESRFRFNGPGMAKHLGIPTVGLYVECRVVGQGGVGFDIVIAGS